MIATDRPMTRRAVVSCVLGGVALCCTFQGWAAETRLPYAQSLSEELAQALHTHNPLVVMVSLVGCPMCKIARAHHLLPVRAQKNLVMVQIDMRSSRLLKDFKGAELTHEQLIARWGVKVAPTVLFFGPGGTEMAERMEGALSADYYGAILDDRLRAARGTLTSATPTD